MKKKRPRSVHSPLSISEKLWPWCLALVCILTIAWTGVVAWAELTSGDEGTLQDTFVTIVGKSAGAVPLILVYSIAIVVTVNFIAGGGIMVTARAVEAFFDKKLEEGREKLRQRQSRFKREIRAGMADEFTDWIRRRDEARAKGDDFDEPPPSP